MTNKEVIDALSAYFERNADMPDVCRALANSLVDWNRLACIQDLPQEERECFWARVTANAEELQRFIRDGDDGNGFQVENVHTTQQVEDILEKRKHVITFLQVVRGLKKGKHFKRPHWDKIIRASTDFGIVFSSELEPCVFCVEDFEATDWQETCEEDES